MCSQPLYMLAAFGSPNLPALQQRRRLGMIMTFLLGRENKTYLLVECHFRLYLYILMPLLILPPPMSPTLVVKIPILATC